MKRGKNKNGKPHGKSHGEKHGTVCAANFVGDSDSDSSNGSYSSDGETFLPTNARSNVQDAGGARSYASASASASASATSKPGDTNWSEVSITYLLKASLNDLATGRVDGKLKLAANAMQVFDKTSERSKNHICGGIKITRCTSTFPTTLHINVEGLALPQATSFTHTGSCGALTLHPSESFTDARGFDIAVGDMQKTENSQFLRDYAGWTLHNVDSGITHFPDGVNSMFQFKHPLVAYYNAVFAGMGLKPLSEKDLMPGTDMFMAKTFEVNTCLAALKKDMVEGLQIHNLYDVSFKVSRAFGDMDKDGNIPWTSTAEACDNLQGLRSQEAVFDKQNTLYMTAVFKVLTLDTA